MAIFGSVATLAAQGCPKRYGKVFEFLKNEDLDKHFADVAPGKKKEVVVADGIKAIFQEYDTKFHQDARLEGHRKYADVQYIHEGGEYIGYCDLNKAEGDIDYSDEKDIFFCKSSQMSFVYLAKGEAAILEPCDLHAPCTALAEKKHVKKIVFKVKL
ncbi:MAG: YhcH/YjgK/YiaL family protein [Marinilabiliaceae bacterium]|nr:YhcH/YjgK/YiaL family protein [Marinilabiliaceae bacterium]